MENKVSLEAMIHFAVTELEEREYRQYLELKENNRLETPAESYERKMQKALKEGKNSDRLVRFRKAAARAASVFFIAFSLMSMSFLNVRAVREAVAQVIMEWYDGFTKTTIVAQATVDKIPDVEFGYIPEGFELVRVDDEYTWLHRYEFETPDSKHFEITFMISDSNSNINSDNDRLDYYTVTIDDIPDIWVGNTDFNKIVISKNGITFDISGTMGLKELIEIYNNISFL